METFIIDGQEVPNPEDMAMLQALYSRSVTSVVEHLKKIKEVGSGKFMEQYYVGYGHSSIGECGETVMFFENVSILAAKALQNFTLYAGQESSTRYIDFQNQPLIDPLNDPRATAVQKNWLDFYLNLVPRVVTLLKEMHPGNDVAWERAINARAFDICRAFLPIGITTNLSWKTSLRKARSRLIELKTHPCLELRDLAVEMLRDLNKRYASSFKESDSQYDELDDYRETFPDMYHYDPIRAICAGEGFMSEFVRGDAAYSKTEFLTFLHTRPRHVEPPQILARCGGWNFQFDLDYGSFRDLQRHRSASIPQPVVEATYFEPWYLNAISELSPELGAECERFAVNQIMELQRIARSNDKYEMQYYMPLGMVVRVNMYASLPSAIYIAQLRTTQAVHPTMRKVAQQMANTIMKFDPKIKLYADMSPSEFNPGRGNQTITAKEK